MLIGQRIGPFEVGEELGSGAMGSVYKAIYRVDGKPPRQVALKIISLGLLGNEGAMARFRRESAILEQLRHPNIVRLFGAGHYKKTPFIAMEFVDGKTLDVVLADRGRLGWQDVVTWAKQLSDALQHAHEKGIIHRDLKPSNLMITRDGVLKLTDFGIAKDTDVTALTGANSTIGTAAYMSPEQCRGERSLTAKSDLYSLGVVLYELLTGRKPFTADTSIDMFLKHVNEVPVRPSRLVPDLPIWLDNLVMFLLEKDKDHRPMDAATVAKMLGDIEQKVEAQQSVGAEVANAKRKDRPVGSGSVDSGDLDAARLLKSGKKKRRRKNVPWYRQTWVSVVAPLLVVSAIGFGVYQALKPPGIDAVYAGVEKAEPGQKLDAATAFLARFGSDSDPRVEKVRAVFRAEKVREAEAILLRRFNKEAMRRNSEGFDEKAYPLAMKAMDAEAAGELGRAAEMWAAARDAGPTADPAKLQDPEETRKAVIGWVADKRIADIRQEVPATFTAVQKQIDNERIFENPKPYVPTQPECLAARAVRLDTFLPDRPKARIAWERLASDTEKEPEQRVWFMLASLQASLIGIEKNKDDEVRADREKRLTERVAKLEDTAKDITDETPNVKVVRRDVRNACRDVIDLYGDESSETIKAAVGRAKKLLDTLK